MPLDFSTFTQEVDEASCDTECYPDYWSIGFMRIDNGKHVILERTKTQPLDVKMAARLMRKYRVYGFNFLRYDIPMILLALTGASNAVLKQANDDIIVGNMSVYKFLKKYKLRMPNDLDVVDLFDPSPGVRLSLKKYGARMNSKRLAETPFSFDEPVGEERKPAVRRYLVNDLQTTRELRLACKEELAIRNEMSIEYGIDLRSKSDAQIAAALFSYEIKKRTGNEPPDPIVETHSFKFKPPSFIKFETQQLRDVLQVVRTCEFEVKADNPLNKKEWGVVKLPKAIKDIKIRIGFTDYKIGLGGLHSKEKKRAFLSDDDTLVVDRDVRGYYPEIMLATGLRPAVVGDTFPLIFREFVNNRTKYKLSAEALRDAGDTGMKYKRMESRSGTLKIVNNGTYGQTGNPYCFLFAPNLMIQTTMTGQLSILMLIERLHAAKFTVISANTDGIVTVVDRERNWLFKSIIFDWECDTSLVTEETKYAGVYSRDVNSYIALPHDYKTNPKAKIKRKGLFAKAGVPEKHDPTYDVCSDAVVEYLTKGIMPEDYIYACDDFTKFIAVRQVAKPGAYKDGEHLGRMVRWYIAQGEAGHIENAKGDRVAGTTGAMPCMDLPDEFPNDVDFEFYVREAYARLDDIGMKIKRDDGRYGTMWASLPKLKTVHLVDLTSRISACERHEKTVRDAWIEHKFLPEGMRICKKCQAERGYEDEDLDDEVPF